MKKFTFFFCALMVCLSASANYYIVGDFNNWNAATAVEMTTTDGTNYTVQLDTLWGGFKITTARDWNHEDYGASSGSKLFSVGQTMSLVSNANSNNYNVNVSGGYSNAVLSFAITNNTPQLTFVSGTTQYATYYIVGDFNNWDVSTAIEMTTTDGSNYYVQLDSLWGSFKITNARDWNHTNWGARYENYEISWNTNAYYWSDYLKNSDNWDEDPNYNIYVDRAYSNVKLRLNISNGEYYVAFNSVDVFVGMLIMYSNWLYYEVTGLNPNTVAIVGNSISTATDLVIPDSVDLGGENFAVTYIYSEAFEENNYITSVTIPKGITHIGYQAFRSCTNLTSVTWNATSSSLVESWMEGSSDRPFLYCNNITSFVFGNNVQEIPDYLCYYMPGVTSISIPNSVTRIGSGAFYGCSNAFSALTINENVEAIGPDAFIGCNSLTTLNWNAQNCAVGYYKRNNHYDEDGNEYYTYDWRDATSSPFPSSVQTITFGNQVQTIPAYLCYNMSGVTSVTIPNSVTRINNSAFRNCTSLASINLSNNLDYIGSKAFVNSGLMSVMIPESLDTIVSDAFYYYDYDNNDNNSNLSLVIWNARNCANVSTSQNWNSQLQEYEYSYYESTSSPFPSSVETFIFGDNVQKVPSGLCSDLNQLISIALPNTVRTIGNSAFYRCSGLISFTMENGVQTIGNSAFSSCSNLPQIVLPNTVTKIGHNAFNSCSNLTTAIVGNSVDTIGVSAFSYCKRLISIELPTTVNYIGGSAFYNCTSMNKAIIRSTAELDPYCMLLLNPQIDTIIAPASIFDIDEQHRLDYVCTKRMKYVKANSGELTEDAFVVIRRSASTLETLDVSATTNTTIADEAFSNMYRLTTLGLPQGLDRISYKAVAECVRLQSIDIPAGITEIGDRAFEDCRSLTTITFGGQSGATADVALQTIGNWAFYNNHALQHLAIPSGVTTIGAGAFYGCTYLEDLAMPASLRNVGDNAFALCNHLTKMQVEADLPPMVAARTFFDVSRNIPVYVPDEAVNDYRNTAIWQEFFIRPISQAATGIETVRESDSDSQDEMLPDGKFMEDGRLLIRRNGKTYDAQGRLIR